MLFNTINLKEVKLEEFFDATNCYVLNLQDNITHLNLHNQNLADSDWERITSLVNLQHLDLDSNSISEIPESISALVNLQTLDLDSNSISEIPESISALVNLQKLYLDSNSISEIPESISALVNLQKLYLSSNSISEIPESISALVNLQRLYLESNSISTIPESISALVNLQTLSLYSNSISEIPESISALVNLQHLDLSSNSFSVAVEILRQKPAEIIAYILKQQTSKLRKLNEAKVLVVGDERSGKTSVVNRLCKREYEYGQTTTLGIEISKYKIEHEYESIGLNYWDFAGQEITHATHQFFLTKRSLYLLVLDAQKEDAEIRIEYWLDMIKTYGDSSPIIIVINKIEKNKSYEFNKFKYKNEHNIKDIVYISAEKNENISTLMQSIKAEVLNLKHVSDKLPEKWFEIKEALEKYEENDGDFIKKEEYRKLCSKKGEKDESEQGRLLTLLHDLGIVISFEDDNRLHETNIINPTWITNAIYKILRSETLKINSGILHKDNLADILDANKYKKEQYIWILDLMRKFGLCFHMEEESTYLVPFVLNTSQPDIDMSEYEDGLKFRFKYDFLPKNLISRLIVKSNTYIQNHDYWKDGVILRYEEITSGVIISDVKNQAINVFISSKNKRARDFLAIIRHFFTEIHAKTFNPREEVPLIQHENQFIGYRDLLDLEKSNIKGNAFGTPPKMYNISELLNGYRENDIDSKGEREININKVVINNITTINNYYEALDKQFEEFEKLADTPREKELAESIKTDIKSLDKTKDKKSLVKIIQDKIDKYHKIVKSGEKSIYISNKVTEVGGKLSDLLEVFLSTGS